MVKLLITIALSSLIKPFSLFFLVTRLVIRDINSWTCQPMSFTLVGMLSFMNLYFISSPPILPSFLGVFCLSLCFHLHFLILFINPFYHLMALALFLLLPKLPHFLHHLILILSMWLHLPHISRISTTIPPLLTLPLILIHSSMFLDMLNSFHLIMLSSMSFLLMLGPLFFHKLLLFPSGTKQCKLNFKLLNKIKLGLSLLSHLVHHVGYKWVYKLKFRADGFLEQHKAQLIAKAYTQQEGVNHLNTLSPMEKLVIVKILLALVAINGWFLV